MTDASIYLMFSFKSLREALANVLNDDSGNARLLPYEELITLLKMK